MTTELTTTTKRNRGRPRTKAVVATTTLAQVATMLESEPRLGPNSRRAYYNALADFETWRAGRAATKLLVEAYAAHLQDTGRATTGINQALAAVRWWSRKLADMAHEADLPEDVKRRTVEQSLRVAEVGNVDGQRLPVGRIITTGELAALMAACAADESPAGARDAAIIAVEAKAGMRRGELVRLTMADWQDGDNGGGVLVVRKGKRNKERKCFVRNGSYGALRDWLAVRGMQPGPLFLAIHKGGEIQPHGLTTQALADMLRKRAAQAKIASCTWHDFRRSFASTLLDAGVDLVTVSRLMGHEQTTTTARYDLRGEEVQRKAVDAIHVPYTPRRTQGRLQGI